MSYRKVSILLTGAFILSCLALLAILEYRNQPYAQFAKDTPPQSENVELAYQNWEFK